VQRVKMSFVFTRHGIMSQHCLSDFVTNYIFDAKSMPASG